MSHPAPSTYETKWVTRGRHRIHARIQPGSGDPLLLLHGFPDNLHLYDYLMPYLAGRSVVRYDFLGWGESDKPVGYPYTAHNQTGDLDAVIDQLGLDQVVLVAHDASGPPAIDWALKNPDRVAGLVLLNTYYAWLPRLRAPEAILLYSTPVLRNLARAVVRRWDVLDRRLYHWQVGRFITDPDVRRSFVPQLYQQFQDARPAFWRLNDDLLGTIFSRLRMVERMPEFDKPVRIVFGAEDPYLNVHVARWFHRHFPRSELHLLRGARHYVQVDAPERVADLLP
jgi:pimeloyl-ACP methyl ester carboxylesterase